ncbi:MAG: hypothetical protein ACREJ5_16680, partial [Geminicoccaceae bacterium]
RLGDDFARSSCGCAGQAQCCPVDEGRLSSGERDEQCSNLVIAGLDPAIHGPDWATTSLDRAVDARVKPAHDNER